MKSILHLSLCASVSLFSAAANSTDSITVSGLVTDRDGQPVSKCDVFFNKEAWISEDSVHVTCDAQGHYEAQITPGHYNSLYICDEEKYAKTALEFWGWNLNLNRSQVIDAAFDTMEVYSLSAWASNGGSNSIFASFRPMRLTTPTHYSKEVGGKNIAVFDLAPTIDFSSIEGVLDGKAMELVHFNWAYEKVTCSKNVPAEVDTSNGCFMPMIVAQFKKPKIDSGQHVLKIRMTDAEVGEIGEGITHFTSNESGLGF